MKKFTTVIIGILFSLNVFSQLNIATDYRQDFVWNIEEEKWIFFQENPNEVTFFKINDSFTMFTHLGPSFSTSYYIMNYSVHNDNIYDMYIIEEDGDKYNMIIDALGGIINIIWKDKTDYLLLVQYRVKSVWLDK